MKYNGTNLAEILADSKLYWENSGRKGSVANLSESSLKHADLSDAALRKGKLEETNLSGANLGGANLNGANLFRADLSGANLNGTDFGGSISITQVTTKSIDLLLEVAKIIVADNSRLNMREVHCGTAHCGAALEAEIDWCAAACIRIPIPEFTGLFYGNNESMLEFLSATLANKGQSLKDKYLID